MGIGKVFSDVAFESDVIGYDVQKGSVNKAGHKGTCERFEARLWPTRCALEMVAG